MQVSPAVVVVIKLLRFFLFLGRLRKLNVCSPLLVTFSVYGGHEAGDFRERAPLASAHVERWYVAPGVRRVEVREQGVQGTLFIPPGLLANSKFSAFLALKRTIRLALCL